MIDETSTKKGHNYATHFIDAESKELLFTVEGKGQEALGAFAAEMARHGACPEQITEIVMDMSNAFIAGAGKYFPGARVIFDHFHIMKMAGKALDKVRKALADSGGDLRGSIWAIRGNEWTRTEQQLCARRQFARQYPVLGRALSLRERLQGVPAIGKEADLKWWCGWADRSRLQPFRKLFQSIKAHWDPGLHQNPRPPAQYPAGLNPLKTSKRPAGSSPPPPCIGKFEAWTEQSAANP
jgi:transposase